MIRLFKILVALALVIVFAGPYVTGRLIEKDYNNFIAQLNVVNKGQATLIGKFDRGYFTSTAVTQVSINDSYQNFTFAHEIKHGPIVFEFLGWGKPASYIPKGLALAVVSTKLTGDQQNALQELYKDKTPYDLVSTITLNGNINTTFTSYPLSVQSQQSKFNWSGMTLVINTNKKLSNLQLNGNAPLLEYLESAEANTQLLRITDTKVNLNADFDTYAAAVDFGFGNVKISQNGIDELDLSGYEIKLDRKIANNLMEVAISVVYNKLNLNKYEFDNLNFGLNIKNLHAASMRTFLQRSTNPQNPQQMSDEALLTVFTNKFDIDMHMDVVTPDGKISLKGAAQIGGADIKALTPDEVSPTINASADLMLDKKLLDTLLTIYAENQIREMEAAYYMNNKTSSTVNPYTMTPPVMQTTIATWMSGLMTQLLAQKYLILNNDMVNSNFKYSNNAVTINDVSRSDADLNKLSAMLIVVQGPNTTPTSNTGSTPPVDTNTTTGTTTDSSSGTTAPNTAPATNDSADTNVAPTTTDTGSASTSNNPTPGTRNTTTSGTGSVDSSANTSPVPANTSTKGSTSTKTPVTSTAP